MGQCPIAVLALLLALWRLPNKIAKEIENGETLNMRERFARIDLLGFLIIPIAFTAAFVALDLAGKMYPWQYVVPVASVATLLFVLFYYVEKHYAKEPILPINLISKSDVVVPYLLTFTQTAAQFIVSPP